jgi:guanylate kinase
VDGRDYFFITPERFREMVEQNELLEHAEYVAHSYGTPRAYVEQQMDKGFNVILDIEVQGARQVKEKMPEAVLIFILPPSMEELRHRLVNRGTDSAEVIEARLTRAREELKEASIYDYIIVNDKLDEAAGDFAAILRAEHCRYTHRKHLLDSI